MLRQQIVLYVMLLLLELSLFIVFMSENNINNSLSLFKKNRQSKEIDFITVIKVK